MVQELAEALSDLRRQDRKLKQALGARQEQEDAPVSQEAGGAADPALGEGSAPDAPEAGQEEEGKGPRTDAPPADAADPEAGSEDEGSCG